MTGFKVRLQRAPRYVRNVISNVPRNDGVRKKLIIGLIIFIFLWSASCTLASKPAWNEEKSEHFIVYYRNAPLKYVKNIIKQSEKYYDSITEEMGFTRYEGFWTWDSRAKIYLFNDKKGYSKASGRSEWSAAHVDVISREIFCYLDMENLLDIILPHELGHIVFREFIGFERKLPLWLDEGVVSFLEKRKRNERLKITKGLVKTRSFMSLEDLERGRRGFVTMPGIFYAEAASIIEFLVEVYGRDKFLELCKKLSRLRNDQDWFIAFREVYKFKTISDMNRKWVGFLSS